MKICRNCKTRMDDSHKLCPECNCEEFEAEEVVKENNSSEKTDESPTKVIDAAKLKAELSKAEKQENQASDEDDSLQEETPAKKNAKKIGIISLAVVFIGALIAILAGAFSGTNKHYNNAKVDIPADIVTEASDTQIKNTAFTMSQEPFDLQMKIGSSVYQLPMMVKDALLSGWSFGEASASEAYLASGETLEAYFVTANGSVVFAEIKNFDSYEAEAKNCCLISLRVDADCLAGETIQLVKGLSTASIQKDVEETFGECDDITESNNGTTLVYTPSSKKSATFVFDAKTQKLISVSYYNDKAPDDFKVSTEKPEKTENEDKGYSKPTAIGSDVASGVIQIDNALYKFPIPVSEFLDNGWELTLEEDRAILYAEEHLFGTLKKDNIEITDVDVYNFEKDESRIKDCYVVSLDDSTDFAYGITLPGSIKVGMSEDDFLTAISSAAYDFDSTNFNEYVFTRGAYTLVIDIDKDEKTLIYWYAYYDATYEE